MLKKIFLSCFVIISVFLVVRANVDKNEKVIYCYWGSWSHYRPGNGSFRVIDIDPHLCTHLAYGFFGIGRYYDIRFLDNWLDIKLENIAKTVDLKKDNPNLKVMAAVGGWSQGSLKFSSMAANRENRMKFIKSAIKFLRKYRFDGLDFNWVYPAQRGGRVGDRENFVTLLKELNTALKARKLLLSVGVAASESSASISYDIPNFSKHVDLINVMAYDLTGSWDHKALFHSPLQGSEPNNVKSAVEYWLQSGAPANKLVLGIPFYGRSFTLKQRMHNRPGAASKGPGLEGPYTKSAGLLGCNEICEKLKSGWTRRWDKTHLAPYAFKGNQWVCYDDEQSISEKIKYLKSNDLAGVMVWSIENDDFLGACGEKFPLLNAVNNALKIDFEGSTEKQEDKEKEFEESTEKPEDKEKDFEEITEKPEDKGKDFGEEIKEDLYSYYVI